MRGSFPLRMQDILNFLDQLRGGIWRRKYLEALQCRANPEPLVIQQPGYHQDPHFRVPRAQIPGSVVAGNIIDVGMGNQQIDLELSQPVDGRPKTACRQDHITGAFQ